MSDQTIENILAARGEIAPRITPADIDAAIASEHYFTAGVACEALNQPVHPSLDTLTFCVLILKNGFTVTGESACASPENFDATIGRKVARTKAVEKVWTLLDYALKERLSNP